MHNDQSYQHLFDVTPFSHIRGSALPFGLPGEFEILEAEYGSEGEVIRFAADFEQFNKLGERVVLGPLRYNSAIPIPEPATWWLFLLGAIAAMSMSYRALGVGPLITAQTAC